MTLTQSQIERYSRQIIVPKVGGIGQERLLAARMLLIGEFETLAPVVSYMTGAGVGALFLRTPAHPGAPLGELVERMRGLNPEVEITATSEIPSDLSLLMALADSAATLAQVNTLCRERWNTPMVFARLDAPARIAIIPSRPPCPLCARANLLAPAIKPDETAPFVAMLAAVEAFKILSAYAIPAKPMLIDFHQYESTATQLPNAAAFSQCACAATRDRT